MNRCKERVPFYWLSPEIADRQCVKEEGHEGSHKIGHRESDAEWETRNDFVALPSGGMIQMIGPIAK